MGDVLNDILIDAANPASTSRDESVHVHFIVKTSSNDFVDAENMLGAVCRVDLSAPLAKRNIDIAFARERLPG
jgi:hypothetical protein